MDRDGIIRKRLARGLPALLEDANRRAEFLAALRVHPTIAQVFAALSGADVGKPPLLVQLVGGIPASIEEARALADRANRLGLRLVLAVENLSDLDGVEETPFVHVAGRPRPSWLKGDFGIQMRKSADVNDSMAANLIQTLPDDIQEAVRALLAALPASPIDFNTLLDAVRAVALAA